MATPEPSTAKAIEEVARLGTKAIEASEKLGQFLAKVFGEPIDIASAILKDRLEVFRWERQIRLMERCEKVIERRNLTGRIAPVPPKLALAVLTEGSIEENDDIQDLWVGLLTSAMDPDTAQGARIAFAQVIKELDALDARLLNRVCEIYSMEGNSIISMHGHDKFYVESARLAKDIGIDRYDCIASIDNLVRLRCIRPFIQVFEANTFLSDEDWLRTQQQAVPTQFTFDHGVNCISLTEFGRRFIEICRPSRNSSFEHGRLG